MPTGDLSLPARLVPQSLAHFPMKGPVLASSLALLLTLGSACASSRTPESMPAWSPGAIELVAAAAPRDQDQMRIPREVEVPEIWPASGLYLGGALITSQPLGDFDGKTAYSGPTDVVLIPDIDIGAGAGAYLSYRWHMNELLVQYSITNHDGSFAGSPRQHDTSFYDLDVNWRHYFWEKSPFQPYALLGLGWARAEIDNGSTDQATGTIFEDATLRDGINVNVGAGAALYTLPWVVFFGQAMYRFVRYETSSGIDGSFENTPDVDGDGWNVSFGAAVRILPPRKPHVSTVGRPR